MQYYAVFYSRICSVMGRNVQYYYERFGVCSVDAINLSKQWKLTACEGITSVMQEWFKSWS